MYVIVRRMISWQPEDCGPEYLFASLVNYQWHLERLQWISEGTSINEQQTESCLSWSCITARRQARLLQLNASIVFLFKKKPIKPVNTGTRIANWKTNHLAWTSKTRVYLALAM